MRSSRRAFLLGSAGAALLPAQQLALPGYRYEFPRDHFDHPAFDTEWWYYTGNLFTPENRRFGFELTFFRQALDRRQATSPSPWKLDQAYFAHLALTDVQALSFVNHERLNRAGPGLAGCRLDQRRVWNGNWEVKWDGGTQRLQAVGDAYTLRLALNARKAPVIHGKDGVSQKAPGRGKASHYVSFTRLAAAGTLERGTERIPLQGTAWMDHEFFSHSLDDSQAGWDWLSCQFDNGDDLMLYRIRRKDGTGDVTTSGTYVGRDGTTQHLDAADITMTPGTTWASPRSKARYPVAWTVRVPRLNLAMSVTTPLPSQELVSPRHLGPNYWEGLVDYRGTLNGAPLTGRGYLEMTGYDKAVSIGNART